jgi:hypothetical protein
LLTRGSRQAGTAVDDGDERPTGPALDQAANHIAPRGGAFIARQADIEHDALANGKAARRLSGPSASAPARAKVRTGLAAVTATTAATYASGSWTHNSVGGRRRWSRIFRQTRKTAHGAPVASK